MKQPKDDDRYEVNNPRITKGQHIIPAKIIKKWKQNVVITGQPKNCPFDIKFRKGKEDRFPQSERSECFCVYHRWTQNVENWKEKIEKDFYKLCDELDKNNIVCLQIEKREEKKIILNYFYCLMACNYLKDFNSFVQLNVDEDVCKHQKPAYTREEVDSMEPNSYGTFIEEKNGKLYCDDSLPVFHGSIHRAQLQLEGNKEYWTNTWFYIKTKERLYLPDCYKPLSGMNNEMVGVINVSPHSILISQYFISTYLRRIAEGNNFDLSQLDIANPPADCKKVVSFVKIINSIALKSYDKWLIR